jgi:uncharacterized protein (TIGR02147 family)
LLGLAGREKQQFLDWIKDLNHVFIDNLNPSSTVNSQSTGEVRARRFANTHLLSDWLNVFVKDCFQISEVSQKPDLVFRILSRHASRSRIQKSLNFLLFHGYLRRNEVGHIVLSDPHVSVDAKVPSQKVRDFHRACLKIARDGVETYSPEQRLALSLVVPTTSGVVAKLRELLESFGEQLQQLHSSDQLHQITLNLAPLTANAAISKKG